MKTIAKWDDLRPHGIVPLTMESDALGYRILCDFTAKGRKILLRALGIPDISLCEPWNTGSEDDPHIASALLAHCTLEFLGVFALLEDSAKEVWVFKNGTVLGLYPEDNEEGIQIMEEFCKMDLSRKIRPSEGGDRNQHRMTKRLA